MTGIRRGRLTLLDGEDFLKSLCELNIALFDPVSYDHVFSLASQYKLTVYDAAYLDLALKEALPIASVDKELMQAATHAGLMLFQP